MSEVHRLTDDQAHWLRALLESRPKRKADPVFRLPADIQVALAAEGLVHSAQGRVEITLEGIREVSRRNHDCALRTESPHGR